MTGKPRRARRDSRESAEERSNRHAVMTEAELRAIREHYEAELLAAREIQRRGGHQ